MRRGPQSAQSVPNAQHSSQHSPIPSWQVPTPAVRQVSRHFEVVPATTSASANEVQMNASHASHARSSEEADMRLLQSRRGTESVTADAAPAVLEAMGCLAAFVLCGRAQFACPKPKLAR